MMNLHRFFAKCADTGRDPAELLGHFTRWLQRTRATNPALVQRIYHEFAQDRRLALSEEDEPYMPCGWCKDRHVWGDDYCGWGHWFICDWWGFGCVDCGGEPPPPPEG